MGASAPTPPRNESRATILANALVGSIQDRIRYVQNRELRYPRGQRSVQEVPRLPFRTEEYEDARQGAYMADVESAVLRFDRVVQIFAQRKSTRQWPGDALPVWLDDEGNPVPVDPTDAFLYSLADGGGIDYPIQDNIEFNVLYENISKKTERIRFTATQDAVEGFRRGLLEFLTVRLDESLFEGPGTTGSVPLEQGPSDARAEVVEEREASETRATARRTVFRSLGAAAVTTSGITSPPYLPFSVRSRTSGLDIEQAPAYFLSWTFFGGPTTPSDGYILPGLYRFRGQDAQGTVRYDSKKFKVPPLHYASTNL